MTQFTAALGEGRTASGGRRLLAHLCPRFYGAWDEDIRLLDIVSDDLGLHLLGRHRDGPATRRHQVEARRPYSNKRYLVACASASGRAENGILIDAPFCRRFSVTTRWWKPGEEPVVHEVEYRLADHLFDAVSEDMALWRATGDLADRTPPSLRFKAPAETQPRMEVSSRHKRPSALATDQIDPETRKIRHRREIFYPPTIEPERITVSTQCLPPSREHAFVV